MLNVRIGGPTQIVKVRSPMDDVLRFACCRSALLSEFGFAIYPCACLFAFV